MSDKLFNVYDPKSYSMFGNANNTGDLITVPFRYTNSLPATVNNTPQVPLRYNADMFNSAPVDSSNLAMPTSELKTLVGNEIANNNRIINTSIGKSPVSVTLNRPELAKGTTSVGQLGADYVNGLIDKNTYENQLAQLNGDWTTKDWTNLGLSGANAALNAYGMFQQLNLARDQYGLQRDNFNLLKQKYDDDKQARADTVAAIRSSF